MRAGSMRPGALVIRLGVLGLAACAAVVTSIWLAGMVCDITELQKIDIPGLLELGREISAQLNAQGVLEINDTSRLERELAELSILLEMDIGLMLVLAKMQVNGNMQQDMKWLMKTMISMIWGLIFSTIIKKFMPMPHTEFLSLPKDLTGINLDILGI